MLHISVSNLIGIHSFLVESVAHSSVHILFLQFPQSGKGMQRVLSDLVTLVMLSLFAFISSIISQVL